jgi:H+-transporting ATPase
MDGKDFDTREAEQMDIKDLFDRLASSEEGLAQAEAESRIGQYGYNELLEKKQSPILKFLSYFWGPIPWMIEVAAILSAIIGHWEDFGIIMVLLLLNAVVGFWQEHKADNAIELLKKKLALSARVLRDGEWKDIPARELVPGDIVRIRLGDIVPADVKLIEGDYLLVDESALTGESLPVEKHNADAAYSGSLVSRGEMTALVVATGTETFFGRTARLVSETKVASHFQKAIIKIGNYLIFMAISLVAVIFIVALFRHESMLEILKFALVLIVASIPAALPAVLSVTMAVGAVAMARWEAIVSKLVAIEEMAGMDVLCSDKTGTITQNRLSVAEVRPFKGFTESQVMEAAVLASRREDNDPIDNAILAGMEKSSYGPLPKYKRISFQPFDPVAKRAEAEVEDEEGVRFMVSKGAPQAILALLDDVKNTEKEVEDHVRVLAEKGFRALGLARMDGEGHWQYAGLLALYDPPRGDSASTIATAESMGVKVKMLTGDHMAIAKETASMLGMGTNITTSDAFMAAKDLEAEHMVEDSDGFAQVFPEHKYRIVELLQEKGHIVGMTGDGVNDAPALKRADAGIAVAGATDAAKSAADIVFTRPGLSVIVDAIKESRKIFQRMTNYSIYRISETIRVVFFITASILVFRFYPVTALMVVLLALLNDAPIMTIAYDHVKYSDMPEKWNMRMVLVMATFLGLVGVVSSFGVLYIGQHILHLNREMLQSFIYLKLSVAGSMTIYVTRTRGPFWSIRPKWILLTATLTTQTIATFIVVYGFLMTSIGWSLALLVWGYAIGAFLITDFLKVRFYRVFA